MGTYGAYRTDPNIEVKGIILDLGASGKFRLARAGGANTNYERKLLALTKPHRRAIQTGNIDTKLVNSLLIEAYVDTVVLGWEEVTGPDGAPLPFSRENAIRLFNDLPDLFADIRAAADDMALYRLEINKVDAGN